MGIAFLRFSVIASRGYLQIAQKSKPFFLPTCWVHREPVLIKRNPQHMYVYDDEDI